MGYFNTRGNKYSENKIKKNSLLILALITILSGMIISCNSELPTVKTPSSNSHELYGPADRVDVIYFYRRIRCDVCSYAEERIAYLVETYFKQELASGKLIFGIFDVQDSKNSALRTKYDAIGSQLFINRVKNGNENIQYIEKIWYWGCIDNEEVFDKTVIETIKYNLYGEI